MKILYYSGWLLTRIISKLLFRVRVTGTEHIPKTGGFILAANHSSYFDPPLVGSWSTRQMYFFAKRELFNSRLLGSILRRVNALPVKRGVIDRQAVGMSIEVVKRGFGLTVFPEGTRSRDDGFLKPKPGIGLIAKQARCPIVPCYLHGTNKLSKCFWGRLRLGVTYGEPISADWIGSLPDEKSSYTMIAQETMRRIGLLKEKTLRECDRRKANGGSTENTKKVKKTLENPL
jgi:1-acyl-sn-glycerol-3-phosphate acyltransferase